MKPALDELVSLFREDEVSLAQQLVWMELLLERTETIARLEKIEIRKELKVYDPLWENHPKVKQMRTESREKGRAEGRAEGELRVAQKILVNVVKLRFPALAELAQEKATQVDNPDVLAYLVEQVSTAPDENMVRWILRPSAD